MRISFLLDACIVGGTVVVLEISSNSSDSDCLPLEATILGYSLKQIYA